MSRALVVSALAAAIAASACSQSNAPLSPAPAASGANPVVLGAAAVHSGISQSALGVWTLALDPEAATATLTPLVLRAGQANDDVYSLPIDAFLRADSLRLTRIGRTATTLEIGWRLAHPFPSPADPTSAPNAFSNRSDLGVAGQLFLLADVPSAAGHTYFNGEAITNPRLVANADAYGGVGGLLEPGTTATVFPFQTLVDELGTGSRVGVSNGGTPTGNFGSDGWTRAKYGPTNDGWTGYGVLHQGQVTERVLALDLAELQALGSFQFNVAVIAKYNDPRGGLNAQQKRSNRLPPATPDHTRFAYRMPHGALDVERITFEGESGGFLAGQPSGSTLSARVVDWDARAGISAFTDLADEPNVTMANAASVGAPVVEVHIPDVMGAMVAALDLEDNDPGGDPQEDSGHPDDPLYYSAQVNVPSPPAAGNYTGLLRATDPEDGQTFDWRFYLRGDLTLAGSPQRPVTYQVMSVEVIDPTNLPPTATVTVTTPNVANANPVAISVSGISDPDNATIQLQFDWDDNGTVDFTTGPIAVPAGPLPFNSLAQGGMTFTHNPPAPDYRNLAVFITDGNSTVEITPPTGANGEHYTVLEPTLCPILPKAGTDIVGTWPDSSLLASSSFGMSYAMSNGQHDSAAFRASPYLGWFAFQAAGSATTQRELWRLPDTGAPSTAVALTTANLGGALDNTLVHQIEVDSTNRVLFARRTGAGTVSYPQNTYYGTAPCLADIHWFDYSGTPVSTLGGTIATGTERVVALTLGPDDDVYMISHTHQLHRYAKALAYAEPSGYPINLVPEIGDPGAVQNPPAGTWRVHDFVYNWSNQCFYVLTADNVNSATNGRVHRLLCDGTNWSGSPVTFPIVDIASGAHNRSADIAIDQLDSTGALIPAADVQIVVGAAHTVGPDLRIFNSELQVTSSWDVGATIGVAYRIALAITTNNVMVSRQTNTGASGYIFYQTPPAGWQ